MGEVASTLVSVSVAKLPEGTDTALSVKCGTRNLLAMAVPLTANRVVLTLFSSFENIMFPAVCACSVTRLPRRLASTAS